MDDAPGADAIRVLHLDHTSVSGGAELALTRMLMAGPAWRPTLLVPPSGRGGVYAQLADRFPVRVRGVAQPAGVSSGRSAALAIAAARLVLQALATRVDPAFRTADVVDANTARAAAYGALAAATSRVPFVVHLRDLVEPEAIGRFGFTVMSRVALPRADGVIANSRTTLDSARRFLRPDVVTAIISSASGLRRTEPTTFVEVDGSGRPLRIGMLARIDPWKGQMLLLEAFAAAFPEGGARLEFAGGAPFGHDRFAAELGERAAELGISDSVDFLGHVDDVAALLAGWDIAVQASTRPEPLGQNVLQYLAAGAATIVADEGGPTEWVEDGVNGLQFTARDVGSLAEALRRLGEDAQLRSTLGERAATTPGLRSDAEITSAHAAFYDEVRAAKMGRGRTWRRSSRS